MLEYILHVICLHNHEFVDSFWSIHSWTFWIHNENVCTGEYHVLYIGEHELQKIYFKQLLSCILIFATGIVAMKHISRQIMVRPSMSYFDHDPSLQAKESCNFIIWSSSIAVIYEITKIMQKLWISSIGVQGQVSGNTGSPLFWAISCYSSMYLTESIE